MCFIIFYKQKYENVNILGIILKGVGGPGLYSEWHTSAILHSRLYRDWHTSGVLYSRLYNEWHTPKLWHTLTSGIDYFYNYIWKTYKCMFLYFWEKRIILVFLKKFLVISGIVMTMSFHSNRPWQFVNKLHVPFRDDFIVELQWLTALGRRNGFDWIW